MAGTLLNARLNLRVKAHKRLMSRVNGDSVRLI
jgi:hypothetical protein